MTFHLTFEILHWIVKCSLVIPFSVYIFATAALVFSRPLNSDIAMGGEFVELSIHGEIHIKQMFFLSGQLTTWLPGPKI